MPTTGLLTVQSVYHCRKYFTNRSGAPACGWSPERGREVALVSRELDRADHRVVGRIARVRSGARSLYTVHGTTPLPSV